jgi:hypothetical protein
MSVTEQYFSGSEQLQNIDLSNLVGGNNNYLGSGFFSNVYTVRDKSGNEAPDFVVKRLMKGMYMERLFMDMRRKFGWLRSESSLWLKPNFRAEVNALIDLKGQQIGPDIVYANYAKYYYIIEKMDNTLKFLIETNTLKPAQVMKLLALGDRYLRSKYLHDDMHTNNIMWSEKLNDFRIIDWGIYLIIKPDTPIITKREKENLVFLEQIIWFASLYTQLKIQEAGSDLEIWKAISENISNYIARNYSERKTEYDIFDPDFKKERHVKKGIDYLIQMREDYKFYSEGEKKGGKTRKRRKVKRNVTRRINKYTKT